MSIDDTGDGTIDFARVQASAKQHGGIDIVGPPPFDLALIDHATSDEATTVETT
jgi:hypothetical protein